jgi:hypothetical protein
VFSAIGRVRAEFLRRCTFGWLIAYIGRLLFLLAVDLLRFITARIGF